MMAFDPTELQQLREEADDLSEEVSAQIDQLKAQKLRYQHVWSDNLDLEALSRRLARIRRQLREDFDAVSTRNLINQLEDMKTANNRSHFELWHSEYQDRYRY